MLGCSGPMETSRLLQETHRAWPTMHAAPSGRLQSRHETCRGGCFDSPTMGKGVLGRACLVVKLLGAGCLGCLHLVAAQDDICQVAVHGLQEMPRKAPALESEPPAAGSMQCRVDI